MQHDLTIIYGDYRIEWLGFFGSRYRLWQWDDGLLSGGETEGWTVVGEFDARDEAPEQIIRSLEAD